MDRETGIQLLKQAERHVALGEKHIADQERRVAERGRNGLNVTRLRRLLDLFRDMQTQHVAYRDFLLRALRQ